MLQLFRLFLQVITTGHQTLNLARHRADSFSGRLHNQLFLYFMAIIWNECAISRIFKNVSTCHSYSAAAMIPDTGDATTDFHLNLMAADDHKQS